MLGCSAMLPLCGPEAQAQETLALPQITVTAPSPIRRRPSPRPANAVPVTPSAPSEGPMQGALPVVTDQFATVTVVPKEEIQRSPGSTLGDVLFSKPGITGSSFAPGASSRPIIRGLDVNRVGIVDNGIGGGGASDLGEDHFVPVNPLAADQIATSSDVRAHRTHSYHCWHRPQSKKSASGSRRLSHERVCGSSAYRPAE